MSHSIWANFLSLRALIEIYSVNEEDGQQVVVGFFEVHWTQGRNFRVTHFVILRMRQITSSGILKRIEDRTHGQKASKSCSWIENNCSEKYEGHLTHRIYDKTQEFEPTIVFSLL